MVLQSFFEISNIGETDSKGNIIVKISLSNSTIGHILLTTKPYGRTGAAVNRLSRNELIIIPLKLNTYKTSFAF